MCSSDLKQIKDGEQQADLPTNLLDITNVEPAKTEGIRSEERRVGKECRSWWPRTNYRNNSRYTGSLVPTIIIVRCS